MSAPDSWVPVPLRWRHVQAGDVMVSPDGQLWLISDTGRGIVTARRTTDQVHSAPVDPDEVIQVLMPVTERDAVELTRDQLGARLIARTT